MIDNKVNIISFDEIYILNNQLILLEFLANLLRTIVAILQESDNVVK
jgi:hypothetical protein